MIVSAKKIIHLSGLAGNIVSMRIDRGRITNFNPLVDDPSEEAVDFGESVIAPLFCDYHLHFNETVFDSYNDFSAAMISHGIGLVFDGGDRRCSGIAAKARAVMPKIKSSGYAISKRGGYGASIGIQVEDVNDALCRIDELAEKGADYIKIIHSGIYQPGTDRITAGGFSAGELSSIIRHTSDIGLSVYCHANGEERVDEAVRAGASVIVHGLKVSDETLAIMAQNEISLIPTLYAFNSLAEIAGTADAGRNLKMAVEGHLLAVKKAHDRGVAILPGSDAGPSFIPYGISLLNELRMLVMSGIEYEKVISLASFLPMEPGSDANFAVLDDFSVQAVFANGRRLVS